MMLRWVVCRAKQAESGGLEQDPIKSHIWVAGVGEGRLHNSLCRSGEAMEWDSKDERMVML